MVHHFLSSVSLSVLVKLTKSFSAIALLLLVVSDLVLQLAMEDMVAVKRDRPGSRHHGQGYGSIFADFPYLHCSIN